MKRPRIAFLLGVAIAAWASGLRAQSLQTPPVTLVSAVDRKISNVEEELVEAAEAMPE